MHKLLPVGLVLVAVATSGCVYPKLKIGAGATDADTGAGAGGGSQAGGGSAAGATGSSTHGGGAAGSSDGGDATGTSSAGKGGTGDRGDAGVLEAPVFQPDAPAGGTGGGGISTGGTSSAGGTGGSSSGTGFKCPAPADPSNGSVSAPTTTPGSKAVYSCNLGYNHAADMTRTCQADGTWDAAAPTCTIVDCGAITDPANGSVSVLKTTYGSTASYSCQQGFGLTGTSSRTCQADATWSGTAPTCSLADCPTAPSPSNGSVTTTGTKFGSTATYACSTGYTLSSAATRSCQADRTWSGNTPTCTVVDCGNAPDVGTSGSVVVTGTTYSSTATYTCKTGYSLTGTKMRTCQADGTWSGVPPACALVSCSTPPTIANGSVSAPTTTFGATATYLCTGGYTMSGKATQTCQADGTWSSPPACAPVDCGAPSSPAHGSVSAPITTYGSKATYSCDTNYTLGGVATGTCQANATWSDAAPVCSIQMLTVTITKTGTGTGAVTSTPAGISCGSTCVASFAYGSQVSLSATPDANQSFAGWDSTVCTGMGACSFAINTNTVVKAAFSPPPNIVFTSSTLQSPALGGLSGADALCNQLAAKATPPLAGKYVAWLSTATVNAPSRLGSASGWVRPDKKPVVNTVADILNSKFFYPPRLDESGNDLGADPQVMTGTSSEGQVGTGAGHTTCGDLTSNVDDGSYLIGGYASANTVLFTDAIGIPCGYPSARIYCFGVDRQAQVGVTPVAGRRAFTTIAGWPPGAGIAAADSLCQSEASAANLPGTYKALLAQAGSSAASRFSTTGLPWIRSDGIPLASTASAFLTGSVFDVPPNMSADGSVTFGFRGIWGGATTPSTAGSSASTCSNWLSASGTGAQGAAGDTGAATFFGQWPIESCSYGFSLVCLQQ